MAQKKNKNKTSLQVKTREPKKKGIFDNLSRDKRTGDHPVSDILTYTDAKDSVTQPTQPTQVTQVTQPTQPQKDFVKVPNSIVREAIPNRLFKGMSKQTYDVLYQRTRGAIVPVRKTQITKGDMELLTGFSDNTLSKHLNWLKNAGLIKITLNLGKHDGSVYEVFIPEELELEIQNQPNQPNPTNPTQKMSPHPPNFVGRVGIVQTVENKDTYESPKTSLKTLKSDDEKKRVILAELTDKFERVSEKLTGKGLRESEAKKWGEVADLLVMELELAAARTETVSSLPAFLKEILRRKLEKKPSNAKGKLPSQQFSKGKEVSKSLQVGKSGSIQNEEEIDLEKETLSAEEKQKTLSIMQDRIREGHRDLVMSMEQAYAETDWRWLLDNLEEGS